MLAALMLCCGFLACESTSKEREPQDRPDAPAAKPRPSVEAFVVDRRMADGVDKGPLLAYERMIDSVIDPDKRATLRSNRLTGEAIVFGLPGTGDTGPHYDAALERAAEIFTGSPHERQVSETEEVRSGYIALVRIETPGFPCGMKGGSPVPVVVTPLGNCASIVGGHIYDTSLACERTKEVLALHPYGTFTEDEVRPFETFFKSGLGDPEPGEAPAAGRQSIRKFLVTDGFILSRTTTWDEQGREEILLNLHAYTNRGEVDTELTDGVRSALESNKLGLKVYPQRDSPMRLLVVPGMRVETRVLEGQTYYRVPDLDHIYDLIRVTRFVVAPRRFLHVIVDDAAGRMLFVGPERFKKLADKLMFPGPASEKTAARASGDFRLTATPVSGPAGEELLRVEWTRREGGSPVADGASTVRNDIAEVVRVAYKAGCGVDDCAYLVSDAQRARILNAQMNYNLERFKLPGVSGEANEGSASR